LKRNKKSIWRNAAATLTPAFGELDPGHRVVGLEDVTV